MRTKESNRAIHISLWIVQLGLAIFFIIAGISKLTMSIDDLSTQIEWVKLVPSQLVTTIGICETLGGLGLILPSVTRISPILTPVAAICLAFMMILAMIFHVIYKEYSEIFLNILIAALCIFIAWGRYGDYSIDPKTGKADI